MYSWSSPSFHEIIHGYLAVFIKFFHGISISNVVSIKISIAISIYVTIRISINIPHVWASASVHISGPI
jgi:hypothetical protein